MRWRKVPRRRTTNDYVFLLSVSEVYDYLPPASSRHCYPTPYSREQGCYINSDKYYGGCWWWLRTPGDSSGKAARVSAGGDVYTDGLPVIGGDGTVRPTIWIDVG